MNPVQASLRYPQVTLVLTAMVVAVGVHALLTMPRREDPKITIRQGLVLASYPGATAEQVEEQVTKKIETRLFRFGEVRKGKTYSTSRPGQVVVNVELEESVRNADEVWSKMRLDLAELRQTELPNGVQSPIVNTDFGDVVAVLLAVQGPRYGARELKDYLDRIDDAVRTVPAVSKVKHYGEQQEQIYVTSSLERLAQYRVTPQQLVGAFQQQNVVQSGGTFDAGQSEVRLRTTGLFQSEEQIRQLMVDASPTTGQPVYMGDLARVERRYADPTFLTRLNGQPALLLSIEMQEGNNIVDFGEAVDHALASVRPLLPPDLKLTLIANQPEVVRERISHFIGEFGIAIGSVIAVTLVLLPFRVALISAVAIPVTIAATFAALNTLGIELHQVSIAALIVVLGMVVDDAIVIADNYVELLDEGVPRPEAAWRSASDLAVPVLTATLTIIASFLPLSLLPGTTGEFIRSLPVTVSVSLACSYVVAMLLTPVLCRAFIKTGLHGAVAHPASPTPQGEAARRRFSPLDVMQGLYERVIGAAMAHKGLTVAGGIAAFLVGLALMRLLPQQFFPSAERDQFVIDVWMPEGTRIEATDAAVRRLEAALGKYPEVRDVASFVGASAPRFYYNLAPEPPTLNYAQLLLRTTSAEATPELVARLHRELPAVVPDAQVLVRELAQGASTLAANEVRITGDELPSVKRLGAQVVRIFARTPGAADIRTNFHNDVWDVAVVIDNQVAQRLGLTNASIAGQLAGSFQGAPVSTYWEGSRAVEIVLRLEEIRRQSFDNVRSAYLTSNVTGARIPLYEVAKLQPEWLSSRIVRRNGVRTLSVLSTGVPGLFASMPLAAATPAIDSLSLPPGYRIAYGGDREAQIETFGPMVRALLVSLVAIFLILLLQFRAIADALVIMVSIPLALFGAVLGLLITRNPFGFTAFLGIISLTGIVVRNAIMLVEYVVERRRHGVTVQQAALEAGRRRLRPIFLTTLAAAIGVLPMILSGSSLWSPLASVISVGLLCSMVFTLVVVPVVYVLAERRGQTGVGQAVEANPLTHPVTS
jgi:multidrug efflux pump subunit AcrB